MVGGTAVGGVAGFVSFDKRTAHPMRQMQAYKWQEGWVRFCNMARPNFTFTGMTLQDLGHYDGDNNRPTYFASDGVGMGCFGFRNVPRVVCFVEGEGSQCGLG
jgi:hypothetical protein